VPLLDVSTLQGHELHLNLSRQQELVQRLDVSTLQGPLLHLNVSGQHQDPVERLDVSIHAPQGPEL
jgi:hypothetical protein